VNPKYKIISRQENAKQHLDVKRINKSFGNMRKGKYFRNTLPNKNYVHEEIEREVKF
jgi:hypothetical protein